MQRVKRTLSPGSEQSEREVGRLPPSNADAKNERNYALTSPYAFTACTGTLLCHFYLILELVLYTVDLLLSAANKPDHRCTYRSTLTQDPGD